ncbi:unnamed protein product [Rhizopus microsporus]
MSFMMEPLTIQGIRTVYYLDDICLLARTKDEMYKNVQTTLTHLNKLGFIINYSKSRLIPKKIQDFLGFQFNTKTMTISVPTTKMEKLTSRVKQLLKSPTKEIMPLVSKFDWKNYCNDSSNGRCAPTCTASSKGPSQEPTPTTTELGSSMPIVSKFTTGTRMVTDDEFKTKWVAHTHRQQQTGRIAKARLHHLRRCFRLRLGNKFGINKNPWLR